MFHPDRELKQVIISLLSDEGRSISYLSRELAKQGFDMHRLTLTGYLRALTDLNVLKERDVPPAKIYSPVAGKEIDIYKRIAKEAERVGGVRKAELVLYSLYRLLKRPIFAEELQRAGVFDQAPGVQAKDPEIAEARKFMVKAGFKIPTSSKAFVPLDDELEAQFQQMILQIVIDESGAGYLVRETTQTKLEL